jgi:predicted protein tyrosine phosphatase
MQNALARDFIICGLAELGACCSDDVTHVLSILDPPTPEPVNLTSFEPSRRALVRMHDEIEAALGIELPEPRHIRSILQFGETLAGNGSWRLLVHCHMGVSRSTAAMAILFAQLNPGCDEDAIFANVRSLRPQAWPNLLMIEIADGLISRGGRLVAALGRHYAFQIGRRPELDEFMRVNGRMRESDLARKYLTD